MSELYRASETSDAALVADTSACTDEDARQHELPGDLTQHEGGLTSGGYDRYDDGGTLAAEEEGLPTRQEAWEQTWGDHPEYSDESDLAAVCDGDTSTLADEEEGLPTRQEAREQALSDAAVGQTSDTQSTPGSASYEGDQTTAEKPTAPEVVGEGDTGDQDADDAAEASDSPVSDRPDIVMRYPGDYARSAEPPPDVTRVHEHPETWVNEINAPGMDNPGRANNCGECSRSVDNTWSGHPTAAAAMADQIALGEPPERMADWAGTSPRQATMAEIGQTLRDLGPGSSAVVGCDWKAGGGHWFNALNDEGTVKAVDGQSGCTEPWPPTNAGLGFDETRMRYSDAVYFTADGKVVKK